MLYENIEVKDKRLRYMVCSVSNTELIVALAKLWTLLNSSGKLDHVKMITIISNLETWASPLCKAQLCRRNPPAVSYW